MSKTTSSTQEIWESARIPLLMVAVIWLIFGTAWFMDWHLGAGGVYPRRLSGLLGIVTAPLIHGSWEHLISNSIPLLILGAGVRYFYREVAWPVWIGSYLIPGVWVWVAGRESYHIGASGMVYTLAFFLFFMGVFRRDAYSLTLTLIVAFLYGSMIWGVFPIQEGVSWESHLFGGLAGAVMAFYFRKSGPPKKRYYWEDEPETSYDDDIAAWNYRSRYPPPEIPDER